MEKVGLKITPKEFKQLSKWSENIYNTAVVIDYFVANQPEIEECYNIAPVVKHLRNNADVLNAFFIDHEKYWTVPWTVDNGNLNCLIERKRSRKWQKDKSNLHKSR